MKFFDHPLYREDLARIASCPGIPWEILRNSSLMVSGATGMIGSLLIDALMYKNAHDGLGCKVIALGRNEAKARERFGRYQNSGCFRFLRCDINQVASLPADAGADYVLHLASHTHPVAYSTDPIGTVVTNVLGTKNLLDLSVRCRAKRFLFASSNEVYGENRGDVELFGESYCGYIDCNTLRAGYPESKRCGEALCQAYRKQAGLDCVVARLTRSFGPSLLDSDTKALTQFIKNGLAQEDIVLKSPGFQYYSYTYAADAVTGLLTVLLRGENGMAYNVADQSCDIRLKDLAAMVARLTGTRVTFDLPSENEALGFSKATKARLDGAKLKSLGWRIGYTLDEGLRRTLCILQETGMHHDQ